MESIAPQLKQARQEQHLSQNEVATILHISRQSISKWENGHTYPDIDNLILLSDLYKTSIDHLIQNNTELREKIAANDQEIADKQKKLKQVDRQLYQNRNEGLLLLVLALVSAIVPPVGVLLPIYVMWRNTKYNSLYKTIYLVSLLVILISLWGTAIFVMDNWLEPTHTEIYRIN
ncbi:helix-turn-helix domain-containing protein [Secundilactobacillus kimchicus]|uniref:helix-turn-helix domain-containing protein n=1 Tax=Secundilactobacillus kimchicus TaxID=528209 RepID=UPI001C01F1EC|nr:helix-turn-helix transcriptional regulator [Secundilactobacillus kimchicus]MBT9670456.1 helix-turn-helix domain-containing protein [Secundilactobacillus kimchicus]